MSIVKWRTGLGHEIERVECTRESDKCVWFYDDFWKDERKEHKSSSYVQYHDTWEAACEFLMLKAERRVMSARRQLELANSFLGNVKGLRKPE